MAAILEARRTEAAFGSIFDFCRRVDLRRVNRRVVEALVKAGAFDSLGASQKRAEGEPRCGLRRAQVFAAVEAAVADEPEELASMPARNRGLRNSRKSCAAMRP